MISQEKYIELVETILNRSMANSSQKEAIMAPVDESQYIVAGPGSGKTTVLVLKILKYYFVDDISFDDVIVTTFTKKAARELKNRTILWAKMISEALDYDLNYDFNRMVIGTLDSIAEDIVCDGESIEVIDNFTSSALMMQTLLLDNKNSNKKLKQFLKKLKNSVGGVNTTEMNNQIRSIRERIYYDIVDYDKLKENSNNEYILFDIIDAYNMTLKERGILDYPMLETRLYDMLCDCKVSRLNHFKVLLIDEYQDTNYLQEQIYFKMAGYVLENNGNITVVGDDDQSLYRFRGATIDLFTEYLKRINDYMGITPKSIFLKKNYRSTVNIINFVNEFIHLDKKYESSRSINKPLIEPDSNSPNGLPVMGMFRNNIEELTTDLSNLIYDLKIGKDTSRRVGSKIYDLKQKDNPSIAILTNSPKEISAYNRHRLPFYVRESITGRSEDIAVFNPRGQNIEATDIVSLICGLILVSIDYDATIENNLDNIPPHTKKILKDWRKKVENYLSCKEKEVPLYEDDIVLSDLLDDIEVECSDLIKESSENSIYHDIIMETINQTNNAISDEGRLSANQIFWHILVPIASGAVNVDDDMFDVSIDENINIMSIHQAKGLEFDIVIVDVGCDIYKNDASSAFKRFPRNGGKTHSIEKYLGDYSKLSLSNENKGLDNAFNDLIRRYFVAYTRAKSLLILVGLNSMRYGYKGDFQDNIKIPNVATGWSRDKICHWVNLDNLIHI